MHDIETLLHLINGDYYKCIYFNLCNSYKQREIHLPMAALSIYLLYTNYSKVLPSFLLRFCQIYDSSFAFICSDGGRGVGRGGRKPRLPKKKIVSLNAIFDIFKYRFQT